MKKFLNEFKAFAMKGNVLDLAVAVIIGTAFGAIVKSLVDDIVMPLIAAIFGTRDFTGVIFILNGTEIRIGAFIQAVVNFLLIALVVFIAIKALSKMSRKKSPVAPLIPTKEELLLTEIRDILKRK